MKDYFYKSYGIGQHAVLDCFSGLIPCKVVGGELVNGSQKLVIEITKTIKAYRKGERVTSWQKILAPFPLEDLWWLAHYLYRECGLIGHQFFA